jgi:hypothetical protein
MCSIGWYRGAMLAATDHPLSDARYDEVCRELSSVMGAYNVTQARLVELVVTILEEGHHIGPGIVSPVHYVSWRTGLSIGHCQDLVRLARRRNELPALMAALRAGELTVDQAAVVAANVPAEFDESATEVAKCSTVSQLKKALTCYRPKKKPKGAPGPSSGAIGDKPGAEDADDSGPAGPTPHPDGHTGPDTVPHHIATGTDDRGWHISGRADDHDGAVIDQALAAARQDLWDQAKADTPPGQTPPPVTSVDALVALAESYLRSGQAAKPGSDRYRVHCHLEAAPDGHLQLAPHLGQPLSDAARRLILCDATIEAVTRNGLSPLDVGRATHVIPDKLRRLVIHRDRGCRVPGCARTRGLHVHHIWHWEDGGPTDEQNLIAICRPHHTAHHQGQLAITGTANDAQFRTPTGRLLEPVGTPTPPPPTPPPGPAPTPAEEARHAVTAIGLQPTTYRCPTGERLRLRDFHLNPATTPRAPTGPPAA